MKPGVTGLDGRCPEQDSRGNDESEDRDIHDRSDRLSTKEGLQWPF